MPERFSMATEALSLNVGLSGQFRKLLLDRCNADVAAAAIAAIAANGTEVEVLVEDGICLPNASMQSFPRIKDVPAHGTSKTATRNLKVSLVWQT